MEECATGDPVRHRLNCAQMTCDIIRSGQLIYLLILLTAMHPFPDSIRQSPPTVPFPTPIENNSHNLQYSLQLLDIALSPTRSGWPQTWAAFASFGNKLLLLNNQNIRSSQGAGIWYQGWAPRARPTYPDNNRAILLRIKSRSGHFGLNQTIRRTIFPASGAGPRGVALRGFSSQ